MTDIDDIVAQLERQRAAIDRAIEALRNVTGQIIATRKSEPKAATANRGNNTDGRQRQIEAMRKFWAAKKAGKSAVKKAAKKGGLTEAGRRKLSEAMRQRWAAKRSRKQTAKKAA